VEDIHSENTVDKEVKKHLIEYLTYSIPKDKTNLKVLIVGGRSGITAEIYLPFSSEVDIVE
jgi:hypothetical protein